MSVSSGLSNSNSKRLCNLRRFATGCRSTKFAVSVYRDMICLARRCAYIDFLFIIR
jgi:hypothetical protein